MRFDDAALHRQQQRIRVFGDRRGVAARLVHHGDAGGRAGWHVDRVVARATRRHANQIRALRNQFRVHEPLAGQFIAGGGYVIGVGGLQAGQRARIVATRGQHRQADAGLGVDKLVEHRVQPQVEPAQAFGEVLRRGTEIRHSAWSPYRHGVF
ncbi:hypothetical protein G6F65_021438 [Rhizopus arrhizus]|nr:hypothetical protein G6F65_021438 [Rhizopus arrhizus]